MRSVPGRTACRDRAESFPHSGSKCRSHFPRQRQHEGEADTPDPRLSMVTRAVDNWKQQIIPEPALSHYFHCLPLHRFFGAADRLPRGCTSLLSPFWGSTCQSCFRTQPRPGRWRGRGQGRPGGCGLCPHVGRFLQALQRPKARRHRVLQVK